MRPVFTAYLKTEIQSEQHRAMGDPRPFAMIAMPDGTSDGLIVMRLSQFVKLTGIEPE